jgi:hypothetical protein
MKTLIALALLANIQLGVSLYHHWNTTVTVQVSCAGTARLMNCGVVK